MYLKEKIEEYAEAMNDKIEQLYKEVPKGSKEFAMKWISENASDELAPYIRMIYLGTYKPNDVLKCNSNRYKTLKDIGITITEIDHAVRLDNWVQEWESEAERINKALGDTSLKIFESHAHYNLSQFNEVYPKLLEIMHSIGRIDKIIIPAVEYATNKQMKKLFDSPGYDYLYYSFGSHPKYLWKEEGEWTDERWEEFRNLLNADKKRVAVGEAGLDYTVDVLDDRHRSMQKEFFSNFIKEANTAGLPVIMHIRPADFENYCPYDADKDAIEIIKNNPIVKGAVAHCFGGNYDTMKSYMNVGVRYFGIGGRITYGEEGLMEAVKKMPEESILLETDAPYIKLNGDPKPNTSLALFDIAKKIAEVKGCSTEHIIEASYVNGMRLFKTDTGERL